MARPKKPFNEIRDNRYAVYLDDNYSNLVESIARLKGVPPALLLHVFIKNQLDTVFCADSVTHDKHI